jgi:pyrimidine-specific ribonucleoside hydrolase
LNRPAASSDNEALVKLLVAVGVLLVAITVAAAAGAALASGGVRAGGSTTRVVVDTDLGFDDVMALSLLSSRRDIAIEAVTVAGTGLATCPHDAYRAARILRYLRRGAVPVACGRGFPLAGDNAFPVEWREAAGKLGAGLPPARDAVSRLDAPDLIARAAGDSRTPVTLVTLGPLTNVAEALRRHPSIRTRIRRIVAMAGAVNVRGNIGPGHDRAEFNVWVDPVAAREVFASGIPVTLVPLDATNQVPVEPLLVHQIERRSTREATIAKKALRAMAGPPTFYWDPLAAAVVVDSGVVRTQRMRLSVVVSGDARNGTLRRTPTAPIFHVATSARRTRFEQLLLRSLAHDPSATIPLPKPGFTLTATLTGCSIRAHTSTAGRGWIRVVRTSRGTWVAGLVKLSEGKTVQDLKAAIAIAHRNQPPPSWAFPVAVASASRGNDGWGEYTATPGRYAAVCFDLINRPRVAPDMIELS